MIQFLYLFIIFIGLCHSQAPPLWNETYSKGEVVRVGDIDVYSVGSSIGANKNLSFIVIYDIFGFNISQTRVFCDRLSAKYQAEVAMPDFFRGITAAAHWYNLTTVLSIIGNWSLISSDLINVATWLRRTSSYRRIALVGFCWGGLQNVRACSNLSTLFFTGISIHGAWLTEEEVRHLKQPMLFIAAKDDPPLQNLSNSIEKWTSSQVSKNCQYKTYSNMMHGFVSTGANYSDPENIQAIDDVHETIQAYLEKFSTNSAFGKYFSTRWHIILLFLWILIKVTKMN